MDPPPAAHRDPAMDPPPPAALMDELVEEVLIRVPPDDPASLVRAALVCKRWCRLIAGASFRRRFRELHPRPPMLGYLYRRPEDTDFVPTSSFRPPHAVRDGWRVLDARHGRVLVLDWAAQYKTMDVVLVVWDPVSDEQRRLPALRTATLFSSWNAALLCAAAGCDHLDCRRGPFLVVVVATGLSSPAKASTHVYSSDQGAWSEPINVSHVSHRYDFIMMAHRALVGNSLYFNYKLNTKILEYDLGTREPSVINLPSAFHGWHIVLMESEDGVLGFATVQESKLSLWAREAGLGGYAGWAQRRVIELDKLLPVSDCSRSLSPYVDPIACPPYVVSGQEDRTVHFQLQGCSLHELLHSSTESGLDG
ncbi:unnamed protein product [Urochloa decumbens]|uniref:F-box domain-containing protein n=1 Tax=Urochloa decumbens TaxID=240449 RepID=A0ABC9GB26_9POAL